MDQGGGRVTRVGGGVAVLPIRDRATLFPRGRQIGLDLMTKTEKLLTWLGMWGAMRGFCPLTAAIIVSVALLESLTPPVARLFSAVPVNLIHVFAVGIGLLLGLIGYFAGESWDLLFEMFYGPKGKWLETPHRPFLVLPPGPTLKRHRNQAAQALPRKSEAEEGVYREAVKVAKRQVERWEGIERPLILSRFMRSFLWPCLFAAILAACGAVIFPVFGAAMEVPRFLATAGGSLVLALLFLVPYSRLRVEHMIRLYQDVAGHSPKRKAERR
jgi:hypothetical protein